MQTSLFRLGAMFVATASLATGVNASDWRVSVELSDGSRFVGEPQFDRVPFKVGGALREIGIHQLVFAKRSDVGWKLYTDDGETQVGDFAAATLKLKTLVGDLNIPLEHTVTLGSYPTAPTIDLPAAKDLVVYLNFDRNSGSMSRNLASGRHHANVRNVKWTPDGKRRGGFFFAGRGKIEIPHHEQLSPDEFTLAAWIKAVGPGSPWRLILGKTSAGSWNGGYGFYRYTGDDQNLHFFAGSYTNSVSTPIPKGEWIHIAGVCDGSQITLYVNSEPTPARKVNYGGPGAQQSTAPFTIGADSTGYPWIGRMDEVVLYRRALTQIEIEELMIAGNPE